ncbi:MAG: hypothetical protein ACI837_002108 [Crocinitomicaceae bacterium]|jgi:hypothetical protein
MKSPFILFFFVFLSTQLCYAQKMKSELIYTLTDSEEIYAPWEQDVDPRTYFTKDGLKCAVIIKTEMGYKVVSNDYESEHLDSVRFTKSSEYTRNAHGTFVSFKDTTQNLHVIGYERVFKDFGWVDCQITPSGKLAVSELKKTGNKTKGLLYYDSLTIGPFALCTRNEIDIQEYRKDKYYFTYCSPSGEMTIHANGEDIYSYPQGNIHFEVFNFVDHGNSYSFDIQCYQNNESFRMRRGELTGPFGLYEINNWGYKKEPVLDKKSKNTIFYRGKTHGPFKKCSEPRTYGNGKLAFAFMDQEDSVCIYKNGDTLGPYPGKLHYYKSEFAISPNGKVIFLKTEALTGSDAGTSSYINGELYEGKYHVDLTSNDFYYILGEGEAQELYFNGKRLKKAEDYSGIVLSENGITYAYKKKSKWRGMHNKKKIFTSKVGPWETDNGSFQHYNSESDYTYINGTKALTGKHFRRTRWQCYPDYLVWDWNRKTDIIQIVANGETVYEGKVYDIQYFPETVSYSWIAVEGKQIKHYIHKVK